jgi:hypothetical protein
MSREWTIYVRDMVACCDRVVAYTAGLSGEAFDERGMVFDATPRRSESAKRVAAMPGGPPSRNTCFARRIGGQPSHALMARQP